jgi:hypothetical protein
MCVHKRPTAPYMRKRARRGRILCTISINGLLNRIPLVVQRHAPVRLRVVPKSLPREFKPPSHGVIRHECLHLHKYTDVLLHRHTDVGLGQRSQTVIVKQTKP